MPRADVTHSPTYRMSLDQEVGSHHSSDSPGWFQIVTLILFRKSLAHFESIWLLTKHTNHSLASSGDLNVSFTVFLPISVLPPCLRLPQYSHYGPSSMFNPCIFPSVSSVPTSLWLQNLLPSTHSHGCSQNLISTWNNSSSLLLISDISLLYFFQLFIPFSLLCCFVDNTKAENPLMHFFCIILLFSLLSYLVLWSMYQPFLDNILRWLALLFYKFYLGKLLGKIHQHGKKNLIVYVSCYTWLMSFFRENHKNQYISTKFHLAQYTFWYSFKISPVRSPFPLPTWLF